MTDRTEKAEKFRRLHTEGHDPLVLFNAWDAGSARAIKEAGAAAIGTSSWAVATAQGYEDGEAIPLDFVVKITERITANTNLPVTADVEGGYAEGAEEVAANVARFIDAGVVGLNIEDRRVHGQGVFSIPEQAARIAAIRKVCADRDVPIFINARTDLFFGAVGEASHRDLIGEACDRARAYAAAGADGLFVPGLVDTDLIAELCEKVDAPVNVMVGDGTPSIADLRRVGVRRVSFGPGPFIDAMAVVAETAKQQLTVA